MVDRGFLKDSKYPACPAYFAYMSYFSSVYKHNMTQNMEDGDQMENRSQLLHKADTDRSWTTAQLELMRELNASSAQRIP